MEKERAVLAHRKRHEPVPNRRTRTRIRPLPASPTKTPQHASSRCHDLHSWESPTSPVSTGTSVLQSPDSKRPGRHGDHCYNSGCQVKCHSRMWPAYAATNLEAPRGLSWARAQANTKPLSLPIQRQVPMPGPSTSLLPHQTSLAVEATHSASSPGLTSPRHAR